MHVFVFILQAFHLEASFNRKQIDQLGVSVPAKGVWTSAQIPLHPVLTRTTRSLADTGWLT